MNIYNIKGEKLGELAPNDILINEEPNPGVVHEVLVAELASFRQGTASTKTRAMVRGGGRKPWKQKGTGRARQGSIRAPQWVGGGSVFGPKTEKDHTKKVNKKVRKLALRIVLADKIKNNQIMILDDYNIENPSTKTVKAFLDRLNLNKNLFVLDNIFSNDSENLYLSARNLKDNIVIQAKEAGVYWLLKYNNIIVTKEALKYFEEALV